MLQTLRTLIGGTNMKKYLIFYVLLSSSLMFAAGDYGELSDKCYKGSGCNCDKLNDAYKRGGFKCGIREENVAVVSMPTNVDNIFNSLIYKVSQGVYRVKDSVSHMVFLNKKGVDQNPYSLVAINERDIKTVMGYNVYGEQDSIKRELEQRFKRFFVAYDCKDNYTMELSPGTAVSIFTASNITDLPQLEKEFNKYIKKISFTVDRTGDVTTEFVTKYMEKNPIFAALGYFYTDALTYDVKRPYSYSSYPPCPPIELKKTFKPNSSDFIDVNMSYDKLLGEATIDGLDKTSFDNFDSFAAKCLKKIMDTRKKGNVNQNQGKLKLSIITSSSSDNNSSPFCAKDFLSLSRKRADAVKKILESALDDNVEFYVDYKGYNGDGTSGPCAYKLNDNGSMSDDKIAKDLEKYRSVYIKIDDFQPDKEQSKELYQSTNGNIFIKAQDVLFSCKSTTGNTYSRIPSRLFATPKSL